MPEPSGIERAVAEVQPSARSEAMANARGIPRRRTSNARERERIRGGDDEEGDGHGESPIPSFRKCLSLKDQASIEPPTHKLMQAAVANDGLLRQREPREESSS